MLLVLRIKNLGLAEDVTLEFRRGFTALSGETGAGKSMIVGALNLLLGQRADRKLIRTGNDSCSIEAIFDIGNLKFDVDAFLNDHGLDSCEQGQLFVRRTVSVSGANRQFVNHGPATLGLLAELGPRLVDIHGSHDAQSLFDNRKQLELLDAYAGVQPWRATYAKLLHGWKQLRRQRNELEMDERSRSQQLDLLQHQTQEIAAAQLDSLDEDQLENEHRRASNAETIQRLASETLFELDEGETPIRDRIGRIGHQLQQLGELDRQSKPLTQIHLRIVEELDELQSQIARYLDRIESNPERLRELEAQLDGLQSLKRKYGATVADIIEFGHRAERKLRLLKSGDEERQRLDQESERLHEETKKIAAKLSAKRTRCGRELARATRAQLTELGFPDGQFEIRSVPLDRSDPQTYSPQGFEQIEFLFGPNPGEPLLPLKKIASSGEIARVMLVLKTVLSAQDDIPLLIFDEIDANIGGETAQAVSRKMRDLGSDRQVLCITHLAPVAAAADQHYRVTKGLEKKRTVTRVTLLDGEERIDELTRMLGGKTAAAQKLATALIAAQSPRQSAELPPNK